MPRKKEIFTIREAELIQWLSISHKRLDEIVSFFDADPNDDWDLVEGDDYQFVNKEKKLRNFSPKGAFKIASYIEKNEKRGIFYKFKEFFTKHDQKIRRSLARKLIFAELIDSGEIQVYQGVAMIHKQSLRRILETNGAKLNKTVNHLQQRTDKPLELGVDFYEDEKREFWFSESGIVMISKSMSETLTNKSRQEMCKTIAMEFPLAFKEIQENLDDDTKQKIEIEKAKKRAKTRDKNTCQVTGQKPDRNNKFNLAVHHLYSAQKYPHLATLDLNLVTIKEEIHQEFHGNLGGFHQPCTIEDFIEFLHVYYPEHHGNLALKLQKTKKKLEKLAK
jgi:ribosomal protein S14